MSFIYPLALFGASWITQLRERHFPERVSHEFILICVNPWGRLIQMRKAKGNKSLYLRCGNLKISVARKLHDAIRTAKQKGAEHVFFLQKHQQQPQVQSSLMIHEPFPLESGTPNRNLSVLQRFLVFEWKLPSGWINRKTSRWDRVPTNIKYHILLHNLGFALLDNLESWPKRKSNNATLPGDLVTAMMNFIGEAGLPLEEHSASQHLVYQLSPPHCLIEIQN